MTHYSTQPIDQIFVKDYGFLSFAKNMGKNIGKNVSENLSNIYSQKPLDHAKQSATDALKTASNKAIQNTPEVTGDFIGKKTVNKITISEKNPPQSNSETV